MKKFFTRARTYDMRAIHDHFNWVECRLEGTAQLDGKGCNWWIMPTYVGGIECDGKETLVACDDDCKDLFEQCDCKPVARPPDALAAPGRIHQDESAQ